MTTISLDVPDIIMKGCKQDVESVKKDMRQGLVILEYLNGCLSLEESGKLLDIGYRGFLELLWDKGIPIDGLSEAEIEKQISSLRKVSRKK